MEESVNSVSSPLNLLKTEYLPDFEIDRFTDLENIC
jgi:hypothetical protein